MPTMNKKTMQGDKQKVSKTLKDQPPAKKKDYPEKQIDQGDACCSAADFDRLSGRPGALEMQPKVKAQPSKGPFDAMEKGGKAGYKKDMPNSQEKHLTSPKARPARNSRNK